MKEVFVVNTCDGWTSYSSFRLVGVFTSRTQLNKIINQLLSEEAIEWHGSSFIDNASIKELQSNIKYLSIEEITVNERN